MRVFIVHAHPEAKSFSSAMTCTATEALRAAGNEIAISDLYAMGFNPVSDRRNFTTVHGSTTRATTRLSLRYKLQIRLRILLNDRYHGNFLVSRIAVGS